MRFFRSTRQKTRYSPFTESWLQSQGNIYITYKPTHPATACTRTTNTTPTKHRYDRPAIPAHRTGETGSPCTHHVHCMYQTSSARQSISGRDGSSAQDICKAFQNETNRVPRRITYYAHPNATDRSIKDRAPRSYSVGSNLLSRKKRKKKKKEQEKRERKSRWLQRDREPNMAGAGRADAIAKGPDGFATN